DALVAPDPDAALALARAEAAAMGAREIMIGGGAEILAALLGRAKRVELTEIALAPEGDAFLPPLDPARWRETSRETPPRGPRDEADCSFVTFVRV
ncbi:MAG TPA: dihydrofolate reductase, partial [Methylocystis sp.]|nr:dihydrofolate reductase [Methylocystis sp.]